MYCEIKASDCLGQSSPAVNHGFRDSDRDSGNHKRRDSEVWSTPPSKDGVGDGIVSEINYNDCCGRVRLGLKYDDYPLKRYQPTKESTNQPTNRPDRLTGQANELHKHCRASRRLRRRALEALPINQRVNQPAN